MKIRKYHAEENGDTLYGSESYIRDRIWCAFIPSEYFFIDT